MKSMKNLQLICAAGLALLGFATIGRAQNTWTGDQIFTGNVNIGTSGTTRNLTITGSTSIARDLFAGGSSYFAKLHYETLSTIPFNQLLFYKSGTAVFEVAYDSNQNRGLVLSSSGGYHGVYFYDAGTVEIGNSPNSYQHNPFRVYRDNSIVITDIYNNTAILPANRSLLGSDGLTAFSWTDNASVQLNGGVTLGGNAVSANAGVAASFQSAVFGRNNVVSGTESVDEWVGTDPLFVIGNGTGDPGDTPEIQNRNALTVYKNGDVRIDKRQGDIPMGQYGNPE